MNNLRMLNQFAIFFVLIVITYSCSNNSARSEQEEKGDKSNSFADQQQMRRGYGSYIFDSLRTVVFDSLNQKSAIGKKREVLSGSVNYRVLQFSTKEEHRKKVLKGFCMELEQLTGLKDKHVKKKSMASYLMLLRVIGDIRSRQWDADKKKERGIIAYKVHLLEMEQILGKKMFKEWSVRKTHLDKVWEEQFSLLSAKSDS